MREKREKKERVSWRRLVRAFARGLALWWKISPRLLVTVSLYRTVKALMPYATLWFSARLLDEIAGAHRPEQLAKLAAAAVLSAAVLMLADTFLYHRNNWLFVTDFWQRSYTVFTDKMLSMDFSRVDDPKTRERYDAIMQARDSSGWGLQMVPDQLGELSSAVLRAVGAVALCAGLFKSRVPAGSALGWLDSPLAFLALAAVLAAVVIIGPRCLSRVWRIVAETTKTASLAARVFTYYGSAPSGTDRGMDIRTYRQEEIFTKKMSEKMEFGPGGPFEKLCRGPVGGLHALDAALTHSVTGLSYLFVCLKAWAGAFGVGAVTQYVGAITGFTRGISDTLAALGQARANLPFLEWTIEFFDLPNEMYQGSLSVEKRSDRKYTVEFRGVSFRYPGADGWALKNVSFRFRVGQRLAVVGENGSGKTTFIKLLCRLYDPTEGEILLNGIDIRKYNYDQYKAIFSVVFQDFQLLSLPLGQNVAGSARPDAARAADCLQKAGLGVWLANQPKGLDTYLYREFEEDGVNLSGGEAQKVAIARALYKDAPFIVLDEPTAALDPIAEAEVYAGFDTLIEDRTAIYISHRLASCRFCDEIVVFDKGRLVQQGTHDRLVKERGKYAALWEAQAQYYVF